MTFFNTNDIFFEWLNSSHPKIKPNFDLNPKKFLDTKLNCGNGIYNNMVNRKSVKFPMASSSKVPKRYRHNATIQDLYWSIRILMNFADGIKHIKINFLKVD